MVIFYGFSSSGFLRLFPSDLFSNSYLRFFSHWFRSSRPGLGSPSTVCYFKHWWILICEPEILSPRECASLLMLLLAVVSKWLHYSTIKAVSKSSLQIVSCWDMQSLVMLIYRVDFDRATNAIDSIWWNHRRNQPSQDMSGQVVNWWRRFNSQQPGGSHDLMVFP